MNPLCGFNKAVLFYENCRDKRKPQRAYESFGVHKVRLKLFCCIPGKELSQSLNFSYFYKLPSILEKIMYTALYRKWRPQTFSDVVGQDHITRTLKNEIVTNRLSHAYLFVGTRGTGKTTCARIFAKAVNCPNVKDGEPCNACAICKGIDDGTVLDITEIDAASNTSVDNIRDLIEQSNFNPAQTKYRIYIIDEVHMLSKGAFNALLKTLEEPPEYVKFVLATTEAHKMLPTILSRCQRFDFKRIGADVMGERLMYIAEKEGITLTNEAANLISRLSDGAMRDALSILDQCIARNSDVNTALVSEVCGIAGREYLGETAKALLENDCPAILSIISRLYENACDMERYCEELINYFRNIMVARAVKNPEQLIICSNEELEEIRTFSEMFTLPRAIAIISQLQNSFAEIKSGVQGRTAMEMALIKLASPDMDSRDESILKRIAEIEKQLKNGVVVPAAQSVASPNEQRTSVPVAEEHISQPKPGQNAKSAEQTIEVQKEPQAEQAIPETPTPEEEETVSKAAAAPAVAAPEAIVQWPETLQELFDTNRLAWTILNGTTAKAHGSTVIVYGSHPSIPDILAIKINSDDVLAALEKVTGTAYSRVISQKDAADLVADSPAAEKPKQNPVDALIQKAKQSEIPIEYI